GPPRGDYRRQPADANQAGEPAPFVRPARGSPGDARSWPRRHLGRVRSAPGGQDQWRNRMTSQAVTVVNQLGMHARAAAKFVHLATRYDARVKVARDRREMDGKSIMGILLLAAARGSTITISAEGSDERDAVDALVALVRSGFGEDVCSA